MERKGFLRTMESVTAIVIIMSFLLFLGSSYYSASTEIDASAAGYDALRELDSRGELRPYALSGDGDSIRSGIEIRGYNHSVGLCDQSGNCTGEYPDAEDIAVSGYIIAGDGQYSPMEVRIYMWRDE